jgi:hypothetical protein
LKRIRFAFVFLIAGLALLLLWEGWIWSKMVTLPKDYAPSDFSIFYTAGRIAAEGQYPQLYSIPIQLHQQEILLGHFLRTEQLLPFNHPPLLVPILQILCSTDYMASYWRWMFVMLALLVGTALLANRLLQSEGWDRSTRVLFFISALTFYPAFVSLVKGQDTTFLLLGGMLWLYGMLREKDQAAGLGLAMLVIRPQIAVLMAVPFLFKRRKVFWWFVGGAAVLTLYSLLLIGFQGARDFIQLVFISAYGRGFGMFQVAMFNFTGLAIRLFPAVDLDLVHWVAWGVFLAAIVWLSILWKRTPRLGLWQLVLMTCLAVFAAPHLHYHDLAFLFVPILAAILVLKRARRLTSVQGVAVFVGISALLLLSDSWDPARLTTPYLLMAGLPLAAWRVEKLLEDH